ncbi:MAG: hypothetical protein KJ067_23270 [Vicinamibacteria bacterium]|nr:hypothetical protein [Vicinamibacteria bacterium]
MQLASQLHALGVPAPEREYRFAKPERDWRFDFAWPSRRIAVEVEGGVWARPRTLGDGQGGRHNRGAGYLRDLEKYNGAALRGWVLLRYTDREIKSWTAAHEIARALGVEVPRR